MAGSGKTYGNYGWGFTPTSGTLLPLGGVMSSSVDPQGSIAAFAADMAIFNQLLIHDFSDPAISLKIANITQLLALGVGVVGSVVGTYKDAKNIGLTMPTTGDITWTMLAIVKNLPSEQQYRSWGSGTVDFMGYSNDGYTSPISYSITP